MGKHADFTSDQLKILKQVRDRINDQECRDFINKILAENHVAKDRNTFDKLLANANLNSYDPNANYTNVELGVSMDALLGLRNAFNNDNAPCPSVHSQE